MSAIIAAGLEALNLVRQAFDMELVKTSAQAQQETASILRKLGTR